MINCGYFKDINALSIHPCSVFVSVCVRLK